MKSSSLSRKKKHTQLPTKYPKKKKQKTKNIASPQESLAADQPDDPNLNPNLITNLNPNSSANQLNVPNAKFRQKTPFMHRIAQLGIPNEIVLLNYTYV